MCNSYLNIENVVGIVVHSPTCIIIIIIIIVSAQSGLKFDYIKWILGERNKKSKQAKLRTACYFKTRTTKLGSCRISVHEPCHQNLESLNHSSPEKVTQTELTYSNKLHVVEAKWPRDSLTLTLISLWFAKRWSWVRAWLQPGSALYFLSWSGGMRGGGGWYWTERLVLSDEDEKHLGHVILWPWT